MATKKKTAPKYTLLSINLPKIGDVKVYFSPRIAEALNVVTEDMSLYKGVRLNQLLEAFYSQGKKDGARQAFEEVEKHFLSAQKSIPHKNPGKPKKPK